MFIWRKNKKRGGGKCTGGGTEREEGIKTKGGKDGKRKEERDKNERSEDQMEPRSKNCKERVIERGMRGKEKRREDQIGKRDERQKWKKQR